MPVKVRLRIGAALSAAALAAALTAVQPQAAHTAPAYTPGFITFGWQGGFGWTVLDVGTHQQHTVTPSGGGFAAATSEVRTIRYSPDARQVAFIVLVRSDNYSLTLWAASADGTAAHRIAADNGSSRIAWSPDSSRILFGAQGIESVPADGSRSPTPVVADPCAANPQVTTQGYLFYERACSPLSPPSLALIRPGDTTPVTVSTGTGSVSHDGSRIARLTLTRDWSNFSLTVDEIGGATGRQVASLVNVLNPVVDFGPSGDMVVVQQKCCNGPYDYGMEIVSDTPNATSQSLGYWGGSAPTFLDWVNGPSNLPVRSTADRVGGADRITTAIQASQWAFDAFDIPGRRAAVAVLTRDDLYPDALSGTALAIQMGGPLLLTPGRELNHDVVVELGRVLAPGSTVYLLGGPAALGPTIVDTVRRLGFNPVRLGGADRYATAVAIATAISGTHPRSVLLATGTNFPDALTAGVAAGQERYSLRGTDNHGGGIVLLTDGKTMPAATLAYLDSLKPFTVSLYPVGGPAAAATHTAVPWWPNQVPLVGADRFDTAAKVATSALFGHGAPGRYTLAGITTGLNFPDAMSGGALVGSRGGPLLLTNTTGLTPAENAFLRTANLSNVAIVGGPAAVSAGALTAAADTAFGPGSWDAYTNRSAPPLR